MHPVDRQVIEHFEHVRDTTIELLDRVPDDLLDRVPEGISESVAAEFYHIGRSTEWFMETAVGDAGSETTERFTNRERVKELLKASRERPRAWFDADSDRMDSESTVVFSNGPVHTYSGREWLLTTIDHEVNHRGRLTLALRQMGFTNFPSYRYS